MQYVRGAVDAGKAVYRVASKDPARTLRILSTTSGVLLILGGVVGVFTINPLSLIISLYNVCFGVLIVLTELKNWPVIRTFQKNVDVYFHLLSVPRGKGGFYCFVAFLAVFSAQQAIVTVSMIIVTIVGVIHLFACKRCGAPGDDEQGEHAATQMQVVESGSADGEPTWQGLMKQVVSDSPEVLSAGITSLAGAGSALGAVTGGPAAVPASGANGGAAPEPSPPPPPPPPGSVGADGLPASSNMTN